ncbi:MAG TPA: nodulation protein NfeD [Candidatus Binatia bacterium]|nr:nodulation protein NfeD [Candidatus Binatia bacterium]
MTGRHPVRTTLAALVLLGLAATAAATGDAPTTVARIVIDGTINPAVGDFVHESIARAARDGAAALVIQLDTPGGLLQTTRGIVKDLLAAPLPVIVYVAPSGAGAGSAGVFITMAGHIAAMAPGTSIGAAHPVGGQGETIDGVLGVKIENSTASFSEAIARQRGRNVEWAVKAVRESVSITADEAARIGVVDLVARDIDALVGAVRDRTVDVAGVSRGLDLGRALDPDGHVRVQDYEMRLAQRILNVLGDPNVAYLLMMAGLLGIFIELTHPGFGLPGVVGGICLLLGLTALHILSVNYGGLGLIMLGAALLVAEVFLPSFGLLGVGGLVAFLIGSLFLFDRDGTGLAVDRSLIVGVGGGAALIMLVLATLVVRSQRGRVLGGSEGMIGEIGVVRQPLTPVGTVVVRGEHWNAIGESPIDAGASVEVVEVAGLTLHVRPARS